MEVCSYRALDYGPATAPIAMLWAMEWDEMNGIFAYRERYFLIF
jgi:hypothetical protein